MQSQGNLEVTLDEEVKKASLRRYFLSGVDEGESQPEKIWKQDVCKQKSKAG